MRVNVYLDDFRRCPKGFVLARTAEECLLLLEAGDVDILSLDYDLGWSSPSGGLELTRVMVQRGLYGKRIYLHSSSAAGRNFMYQVLYQGKPPEVELYNHAVPWELLDQIAAQTEGEG